MTFVVLFIGLAIVGVLWMTRRCVFCSGPIWAWSSIGWVRDQHDVWTYWHPDCYEREHSR